MDIRYTVSFPNPETHYIEVEMKITELAATYLVVSLPVWTPGSYLVREYARLIDDMRITAPRGRKPAFKKTDKNHWKISTRGCRELTINYSLYAFEPTVRTNFVDADHATIIGAATFLYVPGHRDMPLTIEFKPHSSWKSIATSLPVKGRSKWIRAAATYDELVDSPVELGNLETYGFKAAGIPHTLAVMGPSNMDARQVVDDLTKICTTASAIFGKHPCEEYLFILLCTNKRYNGLEHLHCSLNQLPRWDFEPREKYIRSIGLLSHEYFHLWNVKRIRPVELSAFDYDREVYTRQLWMVEGVTSYYDDIILVRSGVIDREEYLTLVSKMFNTVVNGKGNTFQSVGEASFDAWIKFYRQHENSSNSQVSYYTKGAMQVQALNLLIMHTTEGKHSFDDVMRRLWKDYLKNPSKGFTEGEFQEAVEAVAGISLTRFFNDHVFGKKPVNYQKYFAHAGVRIKDLNKGKEDAQIGMDCTWGNGKLRVNKVERDLPAWKAGLNTQDEIVAIDGFRTSKLFNQLYAHKNPGDTLELLISRKGRLRKLHLVLGSWSTPNYKLTFKKNPGELAMKIREKWLSK